MSLGRTESGPEVLWEPPAEACYASMVGRFMDAVGERHGTRLDDYDALWRWSVDNLETFWAEVWDFFDIRCAQPYDRVLAGEMPAARWLRTRPRSMPSPPLRPREQPNWEILHEQ